MSELGGGLTAPEPAVNYICHKCSKPPETVQIERDPVLLRPRTRVLCHGEETIVTPNLGAIHHYGHMPVFMGGVDD